MAKSKDGTHARAEAFGFYVHPAIPRDLVSRTVLLARHGAHDEVGKVLSGRSDIGLSASGRHQAARLAARLEGASITRLYSSPRLRARETADIVAHRIGRTTIVSDALDEIDFGEWSGRSFADLEDDPRWRAWNMSRDRAATPAGETMAMATRRAWAHVASCESDGIVLCVSHCDIIRGLVARALGLHADRLLSFDIDPASLTTLHLGGGQARVIAMNERTV